MTPGSVIFGRFSSAGRCTPSGWKAELARQSVLASDIFLSFISSVKSAEAPLAN